MKQSSQSALSVVLQRPPLVILHCNSKGADWFGKYFLNISDSATLRRGPYASIDEACRAIEATGLYRRRDPEPSGGPHFDLIS